MEGLQLLTRRIFSPRYILLYILFFFTTNILQAKTVVIGNGSGFITVADMTGLSAGDILAISPGQYTGAAFSNLTGITITNNSGAVLFTGQVTLNTLVECVFTGFQFKNIPGTAIRWDGNSRRCTESHISFNNCAGSANDASDHNVYTGDTSSLKFYMCTFDSLTLYQTGNVLMGGWGEAKDLACYMDSVVFSRIRVDSTTTNGNEVRGIIFRIDAHDWTVTYKGADNISGDIGIFFMNGSGKIHDIYRIGGRAYIARIWNVGLKTPGNMYFYNNIDLNCSQYGMLDTRVDPVEFTQYTTGGNCYIFNNTAGNLQEHIGYWSSLAVVGTFASPWICQVRNNLGFNLSTNGKPPITMNQSSGTWITDSSNNMYFPSPAGVVDPITCVPVDSSPVIGKGLTLSPIVTDDIYHNLRTGAYDIGAVQHGGAAIQAPPNQPPVALVGAAQTINLPATNTILDGSRSYDPDGTIMAYSWTLASGPDSSMTISSPTTSITKLSGLHLGTYIFKLTVTDNNDSTGFALDTITVSPAANLPPIANAGADQTITLPDDSTTMDGSASRDQDNGGLISTYAWSQSSGPSASVIASPSTAATSVSGLQQGIYVFKLTVTDASGASSTDSLKITVKDSAGTATTNIPPVANAGPSLTIILPTNTTTLDGSKSTDADGTIVSYSWKKISGPSNPDTTGTNSAVYVLTGLVAGQYVYQLQVTDNDSASAVANVKITVVAPPNIAPIANAGADQTITAPSSAVSLDGSASYDPDGSIAAYSWTMVSGPNGANIGNGGQSNPSITGLIPGAYIFQLTVTDNSGATNSDQVSVTVNPEPTLPNQSPVANAGNNLVITAPVSTVQLNGSNSFDPDGTIVHYDWNEVSGPSTAGYDNSSTVSPTVTSLIPGAYVFQLMVTDNDGSSAYDNVTVTVNPAINKPDTGTVASPAPDTTIYVDQIKVFPNPAHDMLNVKITSAVNGTVRLSIYDMNGRLVISDQSEKSIAMFQESLNVSPLAPGMYSIQVNIGNRKTMVVKFIKI